MEFFFFLYNFKYHVVPYMQKCSSLLNQNLQHSMTDTGAVQPVATCRQSPHLHKPAIVTVTSFATELATSTIRDVRTYVWTYVRTPYRV